MDRDLVGRGYKVALPYGEDWDYDLIVAPAETIDWIAVHDGTSGCCCYVPASELATGRAMLHLRVAPPRNGQRIGIRFADDYLDLEEPPQAALVE